jgi:hypothetical protein
MNQNMNLSKRIFEFNAFYKKITRFTDPHLSKHLSMASCLQRRFMLVIVNGYSKPT